LYQKKVDSSNQSPYMGEMMRKYLLPLIAAMGAAGALVVVFWSMRTPLPPPIPFQPPKSPYAHAIFGEGIVEPSSKNISIGSPFNEIVTNIFIVEGSQVKAGDPLFKLDTRSLEATKVTLIRDYELALVEMENQKKQFSFYERLKSKNAVSEMEYEKSFFALEEAVAQVLIKKADIDENQTMIDRYCIKAPIDGEVLQVNIHVGEVAPNVMPNSVNQIIPYGSSQYPLILLGSMNPLNIRIDIDEDDAWRYKKGVPATAFVRGNPKMNYPLKFVRIEPYIIPKATFTGQTIQRVDTRVLQILYQFEGTPPIYGGQLLDIFLQVEGE
jgi:multidrug efflux pump subunit AcrA (membrane-fusion protein)